MLLGYCQALSSYTEMENEWLRHTVVFKTAEIVSMVQNSSEC